MDYLPGAGLQARPGRFASGAWHQEGKVRHPLGAPYQARPGLFSVLEKMPYEQASSVGFRHPGPGSVIGPAPGEPGNGSPGGGRILPKLGHRPPAGPFGYAHRNSGGFHPLAFKAPLRQAAGGFPAGRRRGGAVRAGHRRSAFHRPGGANGLCCHPVVVPSGGGDPPSVGLVRRLPAAAAGSGPAS